MVEHPAGGDEVLGHHGVQVNQTALDVGIRVEASSDDVGMQQGTVGDATRRAMGGAAGFDEEGEGEVVGPSTASEHRPIQSH